MLARVRPIRNNSKRSGLGRDFRRKYGVVYVDPDAGDGGRIDELYQDAGYFPVVSHYVVGPTQIALDMRGLRDGFRRSEPQGERQHRHGIGRQLGTEHQRNIKPRIWFGMPVATMPALSRRLLIGHYGGAVRAACFGQARGLQHGGIDGVEIKDRLLPALADVFQIEGHQSSSRRKLMSTAGAECVMAPAEMKSAPVSA